MESAVGGGVGDLGEALKVEGGVLKVTVLIWLTSKLPCWKECPLMTVD